MTLLEALTILGAATLECKKRHINTSEVKDALDLLERYVRPEWLIPQFRDQALKERTNNDFDREGQQQVLRATFPGIRDVVKDLVGRKMDALAREFVANHDMTVKDELERLPKVYEKLKEPWVGVYCEMRARKKWKN